MKRRYTIFSLLVVGMLTLPGCLWTGQPIDLRCVDGMHKGQDDVKPIAGEKKQTFPKAKKSEMREAKPSRKVTRAKSTYAKAKSDAAMAKDAAEMAKSDADMAKDAAEMADKTAMAAEA